MTVATPSLEDLTLAVTDAIRMDASLKASFASLLEQMEPHSEDPTALPVPMTRPLRSKLCEATDSTWSPTY